MHKESNNKTSVEITEGTEGDIGEVIKIWTQTINQHAEFDRDFTLDIDGEINFHFVLETALRDQTQAFFVAKVGNKIIGFLYGYIKIHSGFFKKRIIAHISDIAVKDSFRRKGVGTDLMRCFEDDFAKKNSANCMSLYVHIQNQSGLEFYDKLGFERKLISMKKDL